MFWLQAFIVWSGSFPIFPPITFSLLSSDRAEHGCSVIVCPLTEWWNKDFVIGLQLYWTAIVYIYTQRKSKARLFRVRHKMFHICRERKRRSLREAEKGSNFLFRLFFASKSRFFWIFFCTNVISDIPGWKWLHIRCTKWDLNKVTAPQTQKSSEKMPVWGVKG